MSVEQNNNRAGRDIVAGNKITHVYSIADIASDEIAALAKKIEENAEETCAGIIPKLLHYMSDAGEIRKLDTKLEAGGRKDQIDYALRLKEQAAKSIMRQQYSATAQKIYLILLDQIWTRFQHKVTPLIEAGSSREEVDEKILEVISGAHNLLKQNPLDLGISEILGLLFFLGGNCHLRWDKY